MAGSRLMRMPRAHELAPLAGLLGVAALSWAYLGFDAARMADDMAIMKATPMAMNSPWSAASLTVAFLMWTVMMVGMMLPSAAPAIMLYRAMAKKRVGEGRHRLAFWLFTAGYLAVWTGFSALAVLMQAGLQSATLLSPMLVSKSGVFSGVLLVAAGIYQWLPFKDACLSKCRSPMSLFLFHWRPGRAGAFLMGLEHGALCLGCCWALMLLLFTAGVMNLIWVGLITAYVFVEKLLPAGDVIGRIAGVVMAVAGLSLIF
ncbi:DUF2182 domain-containing protein [Aestuariispira ectoiniformans]|uniref:DUF2182 domain-containing protein n=1 Tax=Aestuariispira ectoiniformans TaxID=2775080 RepID=UPI00223C094C|nr:DUF2182 domain-containing protein [Aestuariispira ectoiniformans]